MSQAIVNKGSEKWRFAQLGGFDQVELSRSSDLLALPALDQKLWAALSCPTHGLYFDSATLDLLDTDHDGRIRANEVIAAVRWAGRVLKNPDDLLHKKDVLPLAAISDIDPEGRLLLASAKEILKNLGKPEACELSREDLADMTRIFADTRFNGDGIIPVKAAEDEAGQQAITDIIACCGELQDRCGEPGIDLEKIEQFFGEARLFCDWWQRGESADICIAKLAVGTDAAAELLAELQAKIDDYFTRCQLAEFDIRAAVPLNPNQACYRQWAGSDLSAEHPELAALPLANIKAGKDLPLDDGLNPAWRDALTRFKEQVLAPLLGESDRLSFRQWQAVKAEFAAYRAWLQEKPANLVESLGIARLREMLDGDLQSRLTVLVEQDLALAAEAESIEAVSRLVHYYRDLYTLLNNFVSFRDFYNAEPHAIFQAGTLYLDGRSCHLCVMVDDIDKHSRLAELSKIFLAYCQCRRSGSNETMTIVAAFTGGDSDNLIVGRNGVFYDRNGLDWDATIVKIIDNPISIGQAFWAPYKRLARMIHDQLAKTATAHDKSAHEQAFKGATEVGVHAAEQGKTPPPAFDVGRFAGIFAAIGLAIGAIGTALASVLGSLMGLLWWQIPLAIAGAMLLISGPAMFIAYLKLRQRNLAPVLDACGWAVNAKAYINIPFGRQLTEVAKLPKDAERQLVDPFGEKKSPWRQYLLLALVLALAAVLWEKGMLGGQVENKTEVVKVEQKVATPQVQVQPEPPQPAKQPAPVNKK